jgi:hypothetical protein
LKRTAQRFEGSQQGNVAVNFAPTKDFKDPPAPHQAFIAFIRIYHSATIVPATAGGIFPARRTGARPSAFARFWQNLLKTGFPANRPEFRAGWTTLSDLSEFFKSRLVAVYLFRIAYFIRSFDKNPLFMRLRRRWRGLPVEMCERNITFYRPGSFPPGRRRLRARVSWRRTQRFSEF